METHFKKFTVIAIAVATSFLVACKKDQDHASPLTDYKVTDRMQVNNEDGTPKPLSALPVLGNETVTLGTEALSAGRVTIKNAIGENLLLTVASNKDGKLSLTQTYAATDGQASGTIYYALIKN